MSPSAIPDHNDPSSANGPQKNGIAAKDANGMPGPCAAQANSQSAQPNDTTVNEITPVQDTSTRKHDVNDERSAVRPPKFYYPQDIANDLQNVDLAQSVKEEIFATAFEYARCVIPSYSNWPRYVAFMRIFIMGIIAEFKGSLVDVTAGDDVVGYSLSGVLHTLFHGTPAHADMAREYRTFLLITADKTSARRDGELFRRYVNALTDNPRQWFRMRDTDALCRFTIGAALACNDYDHVWFTNEQFEILSEIGDTCYDAISYFKHRSEGETNSTFAYMPSDLRLRAYGESRELLWALDAAWAHRPELAVVINFLRPFGGPIHMMMRRYRFLEEGLTIGRAEDEAVINDTRRNYKLWNRVDKHVIESATADIERYRAVIEKEEELMFAGLAGYLQLADDRACTSCRFRNVYGADEKHRFGGAEVCENCKETVWRSYFESYLARAVQAFPELGPVLDRARGKSPEWDA